MTRTDLAAIVTPVVAMLSLAVWLVMVFYANAHPGVHRQAPAKPGAEPGVQEPAVQEPAGPDAGPEQGAPAGPDAEPAPRAPAKPEAA